MICPEKFKENCINLDVKCNSCTAANKTGKLNKLYYKPLIKNTDLTKKKLQQIINDARLGNQTTEKINYSRQGRKIEGKKITQLGGKPTVNSGATFGDGDGYLELNERRFYIEHKTRFNNKSLTGLTKTELAKAKAQGNELFVVTNAQSNNSIISMDLDTFLEIIKKQSDCE